VVPILIYRQAFAVTPLHDYWVLAAYALFLLFVYYRGFRLKLRVADLVEMAALKCGLARVGGRPKPPAAPAGDDSGNPSAK
jgi:hypothetical protein